MQLERYFREEEIAFLEFFQGWADEAHDSIGQTRKGSGRPYKVHPRSVRDRLLKAGVRDLVTLAAASIHDVFEDVLPQKREYGPDALIERATRELKEHFSASMLQGLIFGVIRVAYEVTNTFEKHQFPLFNRRERKAMEAARLSTISDSAKMVKNADLVDNSGDMAGFNPGFMHKWRKEKEELVPLIVPGAPRWRASYELLLQQENLDKILSE